MKILKNSELVKLLTFFMISSGIHTAIGMLKSLKFNFKTLNLKQTLKEF